MFSPYEELEYLADYLPDEGEIVLVTRESGELVCKPWTRHDLREGVDDAGLYGFLVQANEQLAAASAFPIWAVSIGILWLGILLHGIVDLSVDYWYLVPGIAFPAVFGCVLWIRKRQHLFFRDRILPKLQQELRRRELHLFALIAGVRQHSELRTLLDELIRWSPPID